MAASILFISFIYGFPPCEAQYALLSFRLKTIIPYFQFQGLSPYNVVPYSLEFPSS